MKGKVSLALMASFVLAAAVSAQTAKAPIFIPAADLKWAPLDATLAPAELASQAWAAIVAARPALLPAGAR